MPTRLRQLPRSAFTLIELVVVVAVLVILAGLILPKLDLFKLKANKAVAASNIAGVTRFVEGYRIQKDLYPDGWDSLLDSLNPTQLYAKLDPQLLGPAAQAGAPTKLVLTTIASDDELRSIVRVGISSVHDHDASAPVPSDSAAATPLRALAVGSSVATINAADPDGQGILNLFYPRTGAVPAGRKLFVFGLGPANDIVGTELHDAPFYSNGNQLTNYARFLCVFEVSSTGHRAQMLGTLAADGDPLHDELSDYYSLD